MSFKLRFAEAPSIGSTSQLSSKNCPAARSILRGSVVRTGLTWSFNVQKYSEALPDSHQISGLAIFDCHHVVVWSPASCAAQFVMRRYRVAPHIAETIAKLAGLGVGEER